MTPAPVCGSLVVLAALGKDPVSLLGGGKLTASSADNAPC